ncbi:MAG: hypothetical protein H6978_16805 [Gammaproteobacteria bacterium]|nr:hypothetical protein [Gammaproteobacteria bacterium]
MTGFWIAVAAMCVAAVAILLIALRRSGERWAPSTVIVAVAVPLVAFGLYLHGDRPTVDDLKVESASAPDVQQMIAQLAADMKANPDNVEGWQMLGRSYYVLQRYKEAADAYGEAFARTENPGPELKSIYAESMLLSNQENLSGTASMLFEQVLEAEPDNARALLYGGIVADMRGDAELARARWTRLLAMNPPETLAQALRERMAELGGEAGPMTSSDGSSETIEPAQEAVSLTIHLTLPDGSPADAISGAQALFVLARAPEGGPPVAVVRRAASDVPGTINLSDENAMLPGRKIGDFSELVIVARLSRSGQPIAASGDVYGEQVINPTETSEINLSLDQVVQ